MTIKQYIPNLITSLNLLLGALGVYFALSGRPDITIWCVLAASVFDFADGLAARLLNAYSDIGKDLDSLADLISFGVAPAAILSAVLHFYFTGQWAGAFFDLSVLQQITVLSPFLLSVFSALRLAKFNNDIRQSENFIGLTTTAIGLFIVSFVYLIFFREGLFLSLASPYVILPLIIIACFLLVSEVPMFSLKFKNYSWGSNQNRYLLLGFSLVSVAFLGVGGISVIVLVYVLYSTVIHLFAIKE